MLELVEDAAASNRYRLIPLKTTLECDTNDRLISVYITTVPLKLANKVQHIVRRIVSSNSRHSLQHLRRFVPTSALPPRVRGLLSSAPSSLSDDLDTDLQSLHAILVPVSEIPAQDVLSALSPLSQSFKLRIIDVPHLAPTSVAQAQQWTEEYWPTMYNKNTPFGPHPRIVLEAQTELEIDVDTWMDHAHAVGAETKQEGKGEAIGVVIVERKGSKGKIVAVAGDARWAGSVSSEGGGMAQGNPMAHAVMRGIGMVANSLRARYEGTIPNTHTRSSFPEEDLFLDQPCTSLEEQHTRLIADNDGYLCQDLEIYMTHEPCVMCSMAIVHSRFGRIVFGRRMKMGGITADGYLGLGLWWRKELNWALLGYEAVSTHTQTDGADFREDIEV